MIKKRAEGNQSFFNPFEQTRLAKAPKLAARNLSFKPALAIGSTPSTSKLQRKTPRTLKRKNRRSSGNQSLIDNFYPKAKTPNTSQRGKGVMRRKWEKI